MSEILYVSCGIDIDTECIVLGEEIIPSRTENYYLVQFSFGSEWNNLNKEVIFTNNNVEASLLIDTSDTYPIPKEIIEEPGEVSIVLVGTDTNRATILTTNRAHLCQVESGPNLTRDEIKEWIGAVF